ncbi:MAG: phage terminase large subunit [Nanoarchaeota archaeon]|nr:phage terminase large subunit [Nanoarchaeota archaeon]
MRLNNIDIVFKPLPIQWKALEALNDDETNMVFMGGAARTSKSYLIAAWSTIFCLSYPYVNGAICRLRKSDLYISTAQTLFEFFRHQKIVEKEHYTYDRQKGIIKFNNGSQLFFIELYKNPSDPLYERIMGLSLTFACVDEVSQISKDAINKLQTRLSHMLIEYNLIPKLLIASNPNKGWLYSDFYKPYKDGTLEKNKKVFLGLLDDNKYVSQEYINNLESLDEMTVQRLRWGNWEYDEEDYFIIDYDKLIQMFYNKPSEEYSGKYLSCDIANIGNDKTIIGYWEGLHLVKIFEYSKKSIPEVVDLIKQKMNKYNVPIKNVIVDADGLGIGVADYLKGCVPFKGNLKPIDNQNYNNLRTQCYMKISDLSDDIVLPSDNETHKENIIQELSNHRLKDPDLSEKTSIISKDIIKRQIGRSPDFSDMIMMRMYYELKPVRKKTRVFIR